MLTMMLISGPLLRGLVFRVDGEAGEAGVAELPAH